uniref:Slc25a-10 n=1 Tax=Schmidtea mediterranea TaxID=79327 RepID=A0A0H3YKA9_SCHMD|nr:slc25a-10 [Schmidtea mediterranea]
MKVNELTKSSTSVEVNKDVLFSLLFGGIAGCVAKTVIAPLDRAKINFQTTDQKFSFRAMIEFLLNTYKTNGFHYLWRGNTATMSRVFPYAGIQYTSHAFYKRLLKVDSIILKKEERQLMINKKIAFNFICGSLAGMTSVLCTYPLDLARARMAVTSIKKYGNLLDVLRIMRKEEGLLAFYRGINPTIIGIIPYAGVGFLVFESIKDIVTTHNNRKMTTTETFLSGGIAGLMGQFCCYPLDIIRRRMQTGPVTGHPEYSQNMWRTFRIICSEGLIHGLYKGFSMNLIKTPTASAVSFTVYHSLCDYMGLRVYKK